MGVVGVAVELSTQTQEPAGDARWVEHLVLWEDPHARQMVVGVKMQSKTQDQVAGVVSVEVEVLAAEVSSSFGTLLATIAILAPLLSPRVSLVRYAQQEPTQQL